MSRVSLLGLGRMGAAMAARLALADHEVTVWNRSQPGYDRLAAELPPDCQTPRKTDTPGQAVRDADVVLTVLADGPALEHVLFTEGVLSSLAPGAVVCDLATIGVAHARECAARLAAAGHVFIDAPVSGSVPTVRAGELLVMAGGPAGAIADVSPVLKAFARKIVQVGDTGAGQAMKLSVNSIVHTLNAALAEALVLAESGGVAREQALEVIASSVVAAPFVHYKRPAFTDPATQPVAFTVDLMRKDLDLVGEFATAVGSPMPVSATVKTVAEHAISEGLGPRDMSEIATHHRSQRAR